MESDSDHDVAETCDIGFRGKYVINVNGVGKIVTLTYCSVIKVFICRIKVTCKSFKHWKIYAKRIYHVALGVHAIKRPITHKSQRRRI